jgi:hypothetical protein
MQIRDIFTTKVQERIEPVVKVADRRPAIVLDELKNLIVTPQWERYLYQILQEYADAFDKEDEQDVGIWISGFFGSGKSLLMKELGLLLEGGEFFGQSVHDLFLSRLHPNSVQRSDIELFLAHCRTRISCSAIGGNIHAQLTDTDETLSLLAFRLFARARGYTHIWPFAWAIEYQLEEQGLQEAFRDRACELCRREWEEIAEDAAFYSPQLYEAATAVLPEHFRNVGEVELATENAQRNGVSSNMLITRLRRWCESQDRAGRRHKVLLQFDELGQWMQSGLNMADRIMQIQALIEDASTLGCGRVWIAVTAHGDIQALKQSVQQEHYAKINQRFALKCKLSNEDINAVVQERLLDKTIPAGSSLRTLFQQHSGEITDLGLLKETQRNYPSPDEENFADFYPYLPWTVAVIPDVTKGIAHAAGRGEELTGANRTMISVVQGGILDVPNLLGSEIGHLVCLADLYAQFDPDVPLETRTDLRRLSQTVPKSDGFTTRVAHALYLLGQATYISCTLDNVTRALITSIDEDVASLRPRVKIELDRLVNAGYAKQVGNNYVFLSMQQRSFQEKVLARQGELLNHISDLIMKLQEEFHGDNALRFDRVPISGREKLLRLTLDEKVVRNPTESVTIKVYSPLQRLIAPEMNNDEEMKQRSIQEPNCFVLRMELASELRRVLAQKVATEEVAQVVLGNGPDNNPEYEVARQAGHDVMLFRQAISYDLDMAVRNGVVFFRGTRYYPEGENASQAMRSLLGQLLPEIYSRFSELPYRLADDARTVRDALNHVTTNRDLEQLKVYKADGMLNDGNSLISTLRSRIPQEGDDLGMIGTDLLRQELEHPPFGWDGSWVKVGLALLMRASACRLIEKSQYYSDPGNPEVLQMLTKDQRFRAVRVQSIKTDISIKEQLQIRSSIETIFHVKPPLVLAPLNEALKEQLQKLTAQAQEIENWARTANCYLPQSFEAGKSLLADILASHDPNTRLPYFLREQEKVLEMVKLVQELSRFKEAHGKSYVEVRDFYNRMYNVEQPPEAVNVFLESWRTLTGDRTITEAKRWDELMRTYQMAQQALTNHIQSLQQEAREELLALEQTLPQKVTEASIPETEQEATIADLQAVLRPAWERIDRTSPSINEARAMKTTLFNSRAALLKKVKEIQARYQPSEGAMPPQEIRLTWSGLLGLRHISTPDDLNQVVECLQREVYRELEQHHHVIIE